MAARRVWSSEELADFILTAQRLKGLLNYYEQSCQQLYCALDNDDESFIDDRRSYMESRTECVSILQRIVEVYDLYRDNQYALPLSEGFWRSRECLINQIASFFDNKNDVDRVCYLASILYEENQRVRFL